MLSVFWLCVILTISCFGFECGILVLIVLVPDHCNLVALICAVKA